MMTEAATPHEIFISYSRQDNLPRKGDLRGWVSALRDEILADHRRFSTEPLRIFLDEHDIRTMDDWRHHILEGLRHSHVLLVCLSPNYFASDYCRWEWEEYVQRQVRRLAGHENVAPVYIVDVPGSDPRFNAESLARWRADVMRPDYVDLREWFPNRLEALREKAVRQRMDELGASLWERVQRARRATGVPGNLRRLNPHFVGRAAELRQLHEKLAAGTIGVVTALHGLGGQGKTEVAVAYAHCYADQYPAGLWVLDAEWRGELLPLLGELTQELGLPPSAGPDEIAEQRGRRVLAELKQRALAIRERSPKEPAACLVLLDNVTDPALLAEPQIARLPREDWLRVVVATRLGEDSLAASQKESLAFVAVDALKEADALALLRNHQPGELWASAEDETAAREIVRELGGFALAVESVALYLGLHPEIRPAAYLSRLRQEGLPGADQLGTDPDVGAQVQHREKQLALALDATLATLTPVARTALDYAALLPPDSIPWPWLRNLVGQAHPGALGHKEGRPDPWIAVRRRLEGLRLLTPADHSEIARIHRLVAAHLRERMGREQVTGRTEAILRQVGDTAYLLEETAEHESSHLWMLSPLQEVVLHLAGEEPVPSLALAADIAGGIEMTIGRLDRAGVFLKLACDHRTRLLAANPNSAQAARDVSVSLNKLGDFYLSRGQAGDAEEALRCFQKGLEINEQLLAANPDSEQAALNVSVSLERLGNFYLRRGQTGDAEEALRCFQETLKTGGQLLKANPDSMQTARQVSVSLIQVGDFCLRRGQAGDAEEALRCFQACHEVLEQLLAVNPNSARAARDVSVSLIKLGDFHLSLAQAGDAEEALRCFQKALEMAEQLLEVSPNSAQAARDVSVSLIKVGDFYLRRGQAGDAEEALRCLRKALEIAEQLLETNPNSALATRDVSVSLERLGHFYLRHGQAGDAEEALRCFQKALRAREQLLAANPNSAQAARDVSASLNQLGDFFLRRGQAGDAEEALRCFQRCHEVLELLLAANPNSAQAARDVSVSLERLGDFYLSRGQAGDAEEALRCFQKALMTREQLLAANPNSAQAAGDVSISLEQLGDFYLSRGQPGDAEEALRCFQKALEIDEQLLAANPNSTQAARDVVVSHYMLGRLVSQAGQQKAALEHLSQCYSILHALHEAGCQLDPPMAQLHEQLRGLSGGSGQS